MPKFAKRHYESIARTMQEAHPYPCHGGDLTPVMRGVWLNTCGHLADMLAADNGRFNRNRFLAACEPGANVRARTRYAMPARVEA